MPHLANRWLFPASLAKSPYLIRRKAIPVFLKFSTAVNQKILIIHIRKVNSLMKFKKKSIEIRNKRKKYFQYRPTFERLDKSITTSLSIRRIKYIVRRGHCVQSFCVHTHTMTARNCRVDFVLVEYNIRIYIVVHYRGLGCWRQNWLPKCDKIIRKYKIYDDESSKDP